MDTLQITCFGITREVLGQRVVSLPWTAAPVSELRALLLREYTALAGLPRLAIAVNLNYAQDHTVVQPGDEVALIPPVSGG